MGRYYRVGEVATLTRVSVRTLHHYDRIAELERISAAIGELVDQRLATGEWSWQAGRHQGQLRTVRVRGTRAGAAGGGHRVHRPRRGRPWTRWRKL